MEKIILAIILYILFLGVFVFCLIIYLLHMAHTEQTEKTFHEASQELRDAVWHIYEPYFEWLYDGIKRVMIAVTRMLNRR